MNKNLKTKAYISLILLITFSFSFFITGQTILAFNEPIDKNTVNLVSDNLNCDKIPNNFRTTSNLSILKNNSSLNLTGLDTLNISGSQQFSKNNLPIIKNTINSKLPIIVLDLRQESHGFINCLPISFKNKENNANMDLTKRQVILTEKKQLGNIKLNVPISLYNHPKIKLTPEEVQTEKRLTKSNSLSYIRIPVTDGKLPTNDMVDYFVDVVKECSKNTWFHYHCKEGIGRTTTFMIMHDMMKNYKVATADEILQRQFSLVNFTKDSIDNFSNTERITFLNNFYKYCVETNGNFNTKWSDWIKLQTK